MTSTYKLRPQAGRTTPSLVRDDHSAFEPTPPSRPKSGYGPSNTAPQPLGPGARKARPVSAVVRPSSGMNATAGRPPSPAIKGKVERNLFFKESPYQRRARPTSSPGSRPTSGYSTSSSIVTPPPLNRPTQSGGGPRSAFAQEPTVSSVVSLIMSTPSRDVPWTREASKVMDESSIAQGDDFTPAREDRAKHREAKPSADRIESDAIRDFELRRLEESLAVERASSSALEARLEETEELMAEIQAEKVEYKEKLNKLEPKYRKIRTERDEALAQFRSLREVMARNTKNAIVSKSDERLAEEKLRHMETLKRKLEAQLSEEKALRDTMQAELDAARRESEFAGTRAAQSRIAKSEAEAASTLESQRLEKCLQECEDLRARARDARQEKEDAEKKRDVALKDLEAAVRQKEINTTNLDRLQKENETLKQKLFQLEADLSESRMQCDCLKRRAEGANSQYENERRGNQALRQQLIDARAQADEERKLSDETRIRLRKSEEAHRECVREMEDVRRKCAQELSEVEHAKSVVAHLRKLDAERAELKMKTGDAEAKMARTEKEMQRRNRAGFYQRLGLTIAMCQQYRVSKTFGDWRMFTLNLDRLRRRTVVASRFQSMQTKKNVRAKELSMQTEFVARHMLAEARKRKELDTLKQKSRNEVAAAKREGVVRSVKLAVSGLGKEATLLKEWEQNAKARELELEKRLAAASDEEKIRMKSEFEKIEKHLKDRFETELEEVSRKEKAVRKELEAEKANVADLTNKSEQKVQALEGALEREIEERWSREKELESEMDDLSEEKEELQEIALAAMQKMSSMEEEWKQVTGRQDTSKLFWALQELVAVIEHRRLCALTFAMTRWLKTTHYKAGMEVKSKERKKGQMLRSAELMKAVMAKWSSVATTKAVRQWQMFCKEQDAVVGTSKVRSRAAANIVKLVERNRVVAPLFAKVLAHATHLRREELEGSLESATNDLLSCKKRFAAKLASHELGKVVHRRYFACWLRFTCATHGTHAVSQAEERGKTEKQREVNAMADALRSAQLKYLASSVHNYVRNGLGRNLHRSLMHWKLSLREFACQDAGSRLKEVEDRFRMAREKQRELENEVVTRGELVESLGRKKVCELAALRLSNSVAKEVRVRLSKAGAVWAKTAHKLQFDASIERELQRERLSAAKVAFLRVMKRVQTGTVRGSFGLWRDVATGRVTRTKEDMMVLIKVRDILKSVLLQTPAGAFRRWRGDDNDDALSVVSSLSLKSGGSRPMSARQSLGAAAMKRQLQEMCLKESDRKFQMVLKSLRNKDVWRLLERWKLVVQKWKAQDAKLEEIENLRRQEYEESMKSLQMHYAVRARQLERIGTRVIHHVLHCKLQQAMGHWLELTKRKKRFSVLGLLLEGCLRQRKGVVFRKWVEGSLLISHQAFQAQAKVQRDVLESNLRDKEVEFSSYVAHLSAQHEQTHERLATLQLEDQRSREQSRKDLLHSLSLQLKTLENVQVKRRVGGAFAQWCFLWCIQRVAGEAERLKETVTSFQAKEILWQQDKSTLTAALEERTEDLALSRKEAMASKNLCEKLLGNSKSTRILVCAHILRVGVDGHWRQRVLAGACSRWMGVVSSETLLQMSGDLASAQTAAKLKAEEARSAVEHSNNEREFAERYSKEVEEQLIAAKSEMAHAVREAEQSRGEAEKVSAADRERLRQVCHLFAARHIRTLGERLREVSLQRGFGRWVREVEGNVREGLQNKLKKCNGDVAKLSNKCEEWSERFQTFQQEKDKAVADAVSDGKRALEQVLVKHARQMAKLKVEKEEVEGEWKKKFDDTMEKEQRKLAEEKEKVWKRIEQFEDTLELVYGSTPKDE